MKNIFKKILIVNTGGIGDLIMFTPTLKILKDNFPYSTIDIFSYATGATGVLQNSEVINKVFFFSFQKSNFFEKAVFIYKLRKERYDLVIVASGAGPFKASLFALLTGAKNRAGEYRKFKWTFYNHQVKLDGNQHKIEANLNLLKSLDIKIDIKIENSALSATFAIKDDDNKFAAEFIKKNNLENKTLIGFSLGSGSTQQFKLWPKENFIELGKKILDSFPNAFILLFGSLNEKELCSEINNELRRNVISIVGQPLAKAAALIDKCRILIASDTGLGHIAATTNCNLIAILGPTIPERTGPVGKNVHIIKEKCSYRYHDIFTPRYDVNREHQCLKKITPDRVLDKIKEILGI